jgi:mannose-6-phosphate isomerase-like protein (cupin superfamily)
LHLGLGAKAVPQPPFTGMEWYQAYAERNASDGAEGRLVSFSEFAESWDSWEMHPAGDEVVLCLSGTMTLHREFPDGTADTVTIGSGDYAINPPGVWHTADISGKASALFITAGMGTQHRPR